MPREASGLPSPRTLQPEPAQPSMQRPTSLSPSPSSSCTRRQLPSPSPSPRLLSPKHRYSSPPLLHTRPVPCVINSLVPSDSPHPTPRTMPTPDDAMVAPVEHESIAGRSTCPPDDARNPTAHEMNAARTSLSAANVAAAPSMPMQQPTPPPQDEPGVAPSPAEAHRKPSSPDDIDSPSRDIPTPMTATDDGADEQRTAQASPLSATIPPAPISSFASHLASPFPVHRVCIAAAYTP